MFGRAIDAGQWACAQAGIAALPRDFLTPIAKAELYTARGSPIVGLAPRFMGVLGEAPEDPRSRGRSWRWRSSAALATPLLLDGEKPIYNIGSAPIRYKAHPVQGEPQADQLRAILDAADH